MTALAHDRHWSVPGAVLAAADADPGRTALEWFRADGSVERVARAELAARVRAVATGLAGRGTGPGTSVVVRAPNGPDLLVGVLAAGRLGARAVVVDPALPPEWTRRVLGPAASTLPVLDPVTVPDLARTPPVDDPGDGAVPGDYATATGGSTGAASLVTAPGGLGGDGFLGFGRVMRAAGCPSGTRQLVPGPLTHAASLRHALAGLADGNVVLVTESCRTDRVHAVLHEAEVGWFHSHPYQMRELWARGLDPARLGSLLAMCHGSAPCSPETKRRWIDALGARRVYELYSSSETAGATLVRGDEWLARPGTVGRGFGTQIRILGPDRRPVAPGVVGEVFLRTGRSRRLGRHFSALGLEHTPDGFQSVGDRGRLDEAGYLYLEGRSGEVAAVGGAKIQIEEIRAVLDGHPTVRDVGVRAARRTDTATIEALVQVDAASGPDVRARLRQHCREHLPAHAVPRRWTVGRESIRDDAGKLRWPAEATP